MIYVQMGGRLGNQLFSYSIARYLQINYYPNDELCFDYGYLKREGTPENGWVDSLADFNVEPYRLHNKDGVLLHEGTIRQRAIAAAYYFGLRKFDRFHMTEELEYEKKWSYKLNQAGVYWYRTGYVELGKSDERDKLVSGRFEAPQYLAPIRDKLLLELTPKLPPIESNRHLYEIASDQKSVCLSVRRGDFESNATFKALHSVCTRDYFLRAIEEMKRQLNNPIFILFSDDIDWVRRNINVGEAEAYYENGNDPVWEKLRLMSSCSNFIISNSSFSWWSQWLSANQNKIVISPSRWFNNDFNSPLIDENWLRLDT